MGRSTDAWERFIDSHWGYEPLWKKEMPHPLLRPKQEITQMGELHVLTYENASGYERPVPLADKRGQLAFTPDRWEHLYMFVTPATRKKLRAHKGGYYSMKEIAKEAGGRFTRFRYPDEEVKVLGFAEHITYYTTKIPHPTCRFMHQFGEESGIRPFVCIDRSGNLLLIGGNYTVPDAGITD